MDLTIVIVNWNGGELLLRCLRSIRASRQSFVVKVIVVDNDSSDGSREAAQREFPEFTIFNSGANLGFGRANNLARPLTKTPLVLFLNPDTELEPSTLERSVICLREHTDVGALGCKMFSATGEVQEQDLEWVLSPWTSLIEMLFVTEKSMVRFRRWLPVLDPLRSAYVRKLKGGFLLARAEVLAKAGWFDERYFMYAEDADLSRTILDLGWRLYYCSEAAIVHSARATSSKAASGFSVLMKHESIHKLIRKYQGNMRAFGYRCVVFFGATVRLLALVLLRIAVAVRPGRRIEVRKTSLLKYKLMLLWALGVRRPEIPTSPCRTDNAVAQPTSRDS